MKASVSDTRHKVLVARLTPDQYKALESRLLPPVTTNEDTMLTAGVRLGIQQALKLLREGFVVGEL